MRALLACGLVALASCGSAPGVDHDLSGIVTDGDTGAPISGAMVTFSSDTLRTYDTTTGGDGVYRLLVDVDVPFGQVMASKAGYVGAASTVYFDTGIRRVDLSLHKTTTTP